MKKIIPMMFCFDENYVIPASVAFYSLLYNNQQKALGGGGIEFKLYVIHHNLSKESEQKLQDTIASFSHFATLEFIHRSGEFSHIWKKIKNKHHFSEDIFYKLATPSLFPQYDKIIISDVDVVFLGSVIEEFEAFDVNEDYLVGGVVSNDPELFFPIPKKGYRSGYRRFNASELRALQHGCDAAYLIINLKEWRKQSIEQKALQCLQDNLSKVILPEQDILAIICYPHIKKISMSYVVSNGAWDTLGSDFSKLSPKIYLKEEIHQASKNPIQIHYSGGAKPWNTPSVPKSELWFKYLCKTPLFRDFLIKFEKSIIQNYKKSSLQYRICTKIKSLLR